MILCLYVDCMLSFGLIWILLKMGKVIKDLEYARIILGMNINRIEGL